MASAAATENCVVLQVSIALSLLVAQVAGPPFHDTVLTFSSEPVLHKVQGTSLVEKVHLDTSAWSELSV